MISEKKVVLITADTLSFGGLETHIQSYVNSCPSDRKFILCCRKNNCNQLLDAKIRIIEGLKYDLQDNLKDLWSDIQKLVEIIKEEGVQLVQAHPFSNVIPAFFASIISKIPLVITLHGPSSLKLSYGGLGSLLFFYSILNSSKVIAVSEELKELALHSFYVKEEDILYLPNPIEIPVKTEKLENFKESALFVARLDTFKVEGFKNFIKENIAEIRKKIKKIYVIGDGPAKAELEVFCQQYRSKIDFIFLGYIKKPKEFFSLVGYVMGMGRVIIEALVNDKESILIGYDGCKGVVTRSNFEKCLFSNFSGRGLQTIIWHGEEEYERPDAQQLSTFDSSHISRNYFKWIDDFTYQRNTSNDSLLSYFENHLNKGEELTIVDVERLLCYLSNYTKEEFNVRSLQISLAKSRLIVEAKHRDIIHLHEYINKCNALIKDLSDRYN